MNQQKNRPQTPPQQVPENPKRDVPQADIKRAENEGMTVKPNDPTHCEDVKLSKDHPQEPPADSLEGEGNYTAARRYREGVEQSMQQGNSLKLGENAADALDGPEGADLRHAEQRGMMTPPGAQDQQQGRQQDQQQGRQQDQQQGRQQDQQQGRPQDPQKQQGRTQDQQKQGKQRGGDNHQRASHR